MSKYIITAVGDHNVNKGNGSRTTGTPATQTEAATELIINRLYLIDLLQQKVISKSDTIVTLPERKFLYENIFDNVIDYYDKLRNQAKRDIVKETTSGDGLNHIPYKPFYKHYERDKDLIYDINYNDKILNKKLNDFIICVIRLKNSDTRRNLDLDYWKEFLSSIQNRYDKIFIFGISIF